jgi:Bifunctional DNA primase/polymerase, N-terminal
MKNIAAGAAGYHKRGWKPVPVNRKSKKAIGKNWQNKPYSPTQFDGNRQNVGVQLGAVSGGLVDVDLDELAAVGLAPEFLPPTDAIFGHNSKPCSHQLYFCDDVCKGEKSAIQFTRYVDGKKAGMIVELRTGSDGKGAVTIFPPSMHVTGEIVQWVKDGEPACVSGDELKRAVLKLAVTVLLQPNYPGNGSRHEGSLALGGVLARAGWTADDIGDVMRVLARNAHDNETNDRVKTAVGAVTVKADGKPVQGLPSLAKVWGEDAANTLGHWLSMQANDDARKTITLRAGKLHEVANEAEAALIAAKVPLYARGGELVRLIVEDVPASKGRRTKVARLRPVSVDMMRDHLSRVARFEKYDARAQKMVPADPPYDLAKTLLARDGDWKFPPLKGIITSPTLRPDGSILALPGYDQSTALLLVDPPPMPPIPEQPTRENALAAVRQLDNLLCDFPFVNVTSRSVALSCLITPIVRAAVQVVPLHALDAPEAGSGKSYLVDLASTIATGEIAPVIAAGRNEEETEKRLAAVLMTGQPIVSIDNLNGDLAGDFLCQAIERPIIKPRILGRSETVQIENAFTIFGNGNNIRLIGDVVRRVIRGSLDANVERPELRSFRGDPVKTVLADRGFYIAAVLTIVRAYIAAGYPDPCPPLASFSDWSLFVRSPLVWLGYADPVETMEAARADDPSRRNLNAFVAAWMCVIGPNKPMTAGEIIAKASPPADDADSALKTAIAAVATAPGKSELDAMNLGRWLGRNKNRVVNNMKLFGEPDPHTKQQVWWISPATTK